MSEDQIEFLYLGSEADVWDKISSVVEPKKDEKLPGFLHTCGLKVKGVFKMGKKSKRSAELALKILHKMLNDPTYKFRSLAQKVFNRLTVDQLKIMELGQQYQNHVEGNSRIKTENNVALEMI